MADNVRQTKIGFIKEYLDAYYPEALRYDVVTDKLQYQDESGQWLELGKRMINTIVCECATLSGKNITDKEVRTVLQSSEVPSVHPLRDYIRSLPSYDEAAGDWIGELANQVRVIGDQERWVKVVSDQERWVKVFTKWFVGMVASWMDDEVVNQHVLVLIGKQGIYKTTWLERLLPPELRGYGTKLSNLHDLDKDDRLRLSESALINIDEIDALTERELNQMKSIITSSDVNERAAYAYNKERHIRLASFCASGNKREFLTDTTGNRRWLPFEVESIESPFLHPTQPYKLYYAQAWWLIQKGFNYWFDTEDIRSLESHTESFHRETSEEQLLPIYYTAVPSSDEAAVFRTTAEISAQLVYHGNIKHPMDLRALRRVMAQQGFVSKRLRGSGPRGFLVIENQVNSSTALELAKRIREEEMSADKPSVPSVF